MAKNGNLHAAKVAKNDEFYTMLTDIEKEMSHYKDFFKGKVVYCNCDDARESNFFKYFSLNFEFLGLKKLITTGYKAEGKGVVLIYEGDKNGNRKVDDAEVEVRELEGSGDFRSKECIEFLKEADVVVTNPPFSLFRQYVKQLMDYGKKFIIIGNLNSIPCKDIFSYIQKDSLWLGNHGVKEFMKPTGEIQKFGNILWYTNVEHKKRNTPLDLYKRYSNEYMHYDNYNAIDCGKVAEIPMDYNGVIGVPITFLDKYCPEQFEIVGFSQGDMFIECGGKGASKQFVEDYYKNGGKGQISEGWKHVVLYDANGKAVAPYQRIFIRKRNS